MRALWIAPGALLAALCACGPTVGDACTTDRECNATCLQSQDTPRGYCTLQCAQDAQCPNGTACVSDTPGPGKCLLLCTDARDCRSGYVCALHDGAKVCFGT